jgi:octaprenyl-diphosphate synthase
MGLDLNEKKLTLPLIYAMSRASKSDRSDILAMVRSGGKKLNVRKIVEFVTHHGGLDYAAARAGEFAASAVNALSPLPPTPSKSSLEAFAAFVTEREK